jgi:hypothetical protein
MAVVADNAGRGTGGGFWKFLLAVMLMSILIGAIGAVLLGTHATDRHGTEAELIRQTCKEYGPDEEWAHNEYPDVLIWLVHLFDDKWGCWFVQQWPSDSDGVDFRERTAFCPRDGTYEMVVCYLESIATKIK